MAKKLYKFTGTLGKGGINIPIEVVLFQWIVNALPAAVRGSLSPLSVNSQADQPTIKALMAIQKFAFGHADGLMTPNGPTHVWIENKLRTVKLPVLKIKLFDAPPGASPAGQSNWRWCKKCQGLFFAGGATHGLCPSGGTHSTVGSGNYKLSLGGGGQAGWRWCSKCQGLYFCGTGSAGVCPAGGPHNGGSSGHYVLLQNNLSGQKDWRWCNKCQGLFFAGTSAGVCPAKPGGHDKAQSGNYCLTQN
jgi:hypothetical protein